ncbi:hypothetical protein BDFB_012263 [Asbolus verrucosus]|uniref:Uncharacterized protein n=1 Tax=Asbolus verrucosus TaxID=1661398 RepID=A0A482VS80_ASBVE|nr:hypothetical protein BDFB_012263 [Asbolus verrucosus]
MPSFVGNCTLFINSEYMRCRVEALNSVISLTPFPLFPMGLIGFRIPPQRLCLINPNNVVISLHSSLKVHLTFDSANEKMEFVGMLNL